MRPSFSIPTVERADHYLDKALRQGSQRAKVIKGGADRMVKARNTEYERFAAIRNTIMHDFTRLHDSFPSFDQMSEFQRQIFSLDLEIGRARHALGALKHAITVVRELTKEHTGRIGYCKTIENVAKTRSAYIGRVSSVINQSKEPLEVLNHAREILRNLPNIDDALFTVCIAGFPNVGKSTLLSRITTAKPEIKPYAFTTKGLNIGYFEHRYNKIQCIDTPGTLNRKNPNPIERKAEAAIKYLSHAIVYIFDPTEEHYSLEEQEKLYDMVRETEKTIILYLSKTDIVGPAIIDAIKEKHPGIITDPVTLKKELIETFKREFA
jgi:nucleolar GTP-binding protein